MILSRIASTWRFGLISIGLALLVESGFAQEKQIKLRTGAIVTSSPPVAIASTSGVESSVSGLYLIQFSERTKEEWKQNLKKIGVRFLRYVPDDAFIVRLNHAKPAQLKKQAGVFWIGAYRPEYKIHPNLDSFLEGQQDFPGDVRVLLSAECTPEELREARTRFQNITSESDSRFGRILKGTIDREQLKSLSQSEAALWIEPGSKPKLLDEISSKLVGGNDGAAGTPTLTQQLGYTGSGVTIAVADSGLSFGAAESVHPDLAGRVLDFIPYNLPDAADRNGHGTHVTGIAAGNGATGETDKDGYLYGLGVAPEASIVVQRIFDAGGTYTLDDDFRTLARDAVQAGADIGSNSWGDEKAAGSYDLSAAEFDALVRDADDQTPGDQPYILEFSAGNEGPLAHTIDSPAVAKNVIATGASGNDRTIEIGNEFLSFEIPDNPETITDFSSRGPTEDGRIKPDVVAPGNNIASLQSAAAPTSLLPISDHYYYGSGTSQAGPHVSGAAAVFVQWYRENVQSGTPSPALVKAALINSAINLNDLFGTKPIPNNEEGWGRVDLTNLIGSDRAIEYVDQTELLETGETFERNLLVVDRNQPLKITLTYTDVPALPAAVPALVNDLDLLVIDPSGNEFRGNQFDAGESVPNAPSHDRINNVEGVTISKPIPGIYRVVVRADNVVEDARIDTAATDQDFALVMSGDLQPPGRGILIFDRQAYTAPDTIRLQLIDFDLAAENSIELSITSDSEPGGEPIQLTVTGSPGIFEGTIATADAAASNDGILQVQHGDIISVEYFDSSPEGLRTATATADFIPPTVSNVRVEEQFGRASILWETDEPASAIIQYGTSGDLSESVTRSELATDHNVAVTGTEEGVDYQFTVTVTDEAGNSAVYDNNGDLFSFTGPPNTTVLLVNSFYNDMMIPFLGVELVDVPPPPLSEYTDALDTLDIRYAVWDVGTLGFPTLSDLQSFRVVIWRVPEPSYTDPAFTDEQQTILKQYLDGDGSLFIASMDLLTRVETSPFLEDVLKIQSFATDPGITNILGVDHEPLSDGINVDLDYTDYSGLGDLGDLGDLFDEEDLADLLGGGNWSDTFTPAPTAAPIFLSGDDGEVAGLKFPRAGVEAQGRLVFLGFPLEAIPNDTPAPNNRTAILESILSFLAPGAEGAGIVTLDRPVYSIPSLVNIRVGDSDLKKAGEITVMAFSDSNPEGQVVVLNETARPGEFAGFVSLADANGQVTAAENTLPVSPDDRIRVEYFDESNQKTLTANASLDVVAPQISGVEIIPDFGRVQVRWNTSEPADSLVQFGDSTFLSRTASDPDLKTEHEVTLESILPGVDFYLKILSRDIAGNLKVEDDSGALYRFQSLAPLLPPWNDDLEGSIEGWTVIEQQGLIPEGDLAIATALNIWELGTPANALSNAAFSGTHAWGSNLKGEFSEGADSLLMTPAIRLTGGNRATLRFQHDYNFTVSPSAPVYFPIGTVFVTTNNGLDLETLREFDDVKSGDWKEEQIDLSDYLNQTIRIGFHFGFLDAFNVRNIIQPGWLLDDLSITVETVDQGTLEVASNLSQASFHVEGPNGKEGVGRFNSFAGVPSGEYTVTFDPVPFYQTPQPQSGALEIDGVLRLTGNYTFDDANDNGIADAWEMNFFETVSPDRTQLSDSDGDGYTDYEEFMAGTDPNAPGDFLEFNAPVVTAEGALEIRWNSVAGHSYLVETSQDAVNWEPVSDWLPGDGGPLSVTVEDLAPNVPHLFRMQVRP